MRTSTYKSDNYKMASRIVKIGALNVLDQKKAVMRKEKCQFIKQKTFFKARLSDTRSLDSLQQSVAKVISSNNLDLGMKLLAGGIQRHARHKAVIARALEVGNIGTSLAELIKLLSSQTLIGFHHIGSDQLTTHLVGH